MALSQRSGPPAGKREAVEAAVLAATEALLTEGRTYADLKIEEIAKRAGIGRTGFYFYFRDKRELLMRLTEDVSSELFTVADAWWSGDGDGPSELADALAKVITLYEEHGVLLGAVVESSAYDETVAEFWRALVGRFVEASERRIEAEQAKGAIAPIPAHETAFALSWMTERACYQRIVAGGDPMDEAFVRSLIRIWLGALYGRLD